MALAKSTIEHEFLFRWNAQGEPQGCHIAYREAIVEDGVELSSRFLDPRPIELADADKLAEIGTAINASVLAKNASMTGQVATLTSERDAAAAQVEVLQSQLAALQPVIGGVPQFIKKWQLWAGLRIDDPTLATYNAVKAYTDSFTGMKRDLWMDSTGVERQAPALAEFMAAFGKNDDDLDGMFTRYAAITLEQASALK